MNTTRNVAQPAVESSATSYAVRFAHGAFWSLMGTVGAKTFGFAASIFVARVLGKVGFGELAMIQSTLGLMGTFAGLGIGMTATKYVAELRFKDPERTGRIIGLTYLVSWTAGITLALLCFLLAPWLAETTLNAPHLAPELRLASLLLLVNAGFGPQGAILGGFQAFKATARINWVQGFLSLPLTIPLVLYVGLRGAILAMIFTSLVGVILSSLALLREYSSLGIRPNFLQAWRERVVLWQFSLPAFLASVLYNPVLWAVYAILANQPGGYANLGLFSAAMQFQFLITGASQMLAPVAVPMLAELHGLPEKERFARALALNLQVNWGLALVFSFLVLGLSPWLIYIFGSKFLSAATLLPIIVCYLAIRVASSINGQAFYSGGKMWQSFLIHFAWGFIIILFSLFLIPSFKATGLALSLLIAQWIAFLLQIGYLGRTYQIKYVKNNTIAIMFSLILFLNAFLGQIFIFEIWFQLVNLSFASVLFVLMAKKSDIYQFLLPVFPSLNKIKILASHAKNC